MAEGAVLKCREHCISHTVHVPRSSHTPRNPEVWRITTYKTISINGEHCKTSSFHPWHTAIQHTNVQDQSITTPEGVRIFRLQLFLELSEESAIPFVLLILAGVEAVWCFEALMQQEGVVEDSKPEAMHVQLTHLNEGSISNHENSHDSLLTHVLMILIMILSLCSVVSSSKKSSNSKFQ